MSTPPLPLLPIPPADLPLFKSLNTYVHTYMSHYDASHDYTHILRVLSTTHKLYLSELNTPQPNPPPYNPTILFLSALLHDVGDHKYAPQGQDTTTLIADLLLHHGASPDLANSVQDIVKCVSYTHERRNPALVQEMLLKHPELAIVQDADRLDALGAVGIARCFSYGAAKCPGEGMERAVCHFGEKLFGLEGLMKTRGGREMAGRRTEVLRGFEREWRGEVELSFALE
ncbi:hypothetical protein T440DRAFT_495821 [Plenodomus tracheiphilus IPT5]|uniref:HD/PDEase domain-containing protein n=1 Tax=Plenodomus tracheiphilus IPT5 TaxID=1408161 RepID=A0A6A7BIP0_9PLEO|nr:hypothetical protein T440DRAFT_495821 [Plenodomus tracheiphilus IPT5]